MESKLCTRFIPQRENYNSNYIFDEKQKLMKRSPDSIDNKILKHIILINNNKNNKYKIIKVNNNNNEKNILQKINIVGAYNKKVIQQRTKIFNNKNSNTIIA